MESRSSVEPVAIVVAAILSESVQAIDGDGDT
jgi:hypothetical protein